MTEQGQTSPAAAGQTGPGQPSRPYSSQVRDDQARRTRVAVVAAARDLFVRNGYAATTIDAVAEAAHVSRRTVFNSVGGKNVLLKLALDWALVGDDEPVPMVDRPEVLAIKAERDPYRALRMWADMVTATSGRVSALTEVITVAADADPAAAQLLADAARGRMFGAVEFTQQLASLGGGLAPGITPREAADLCWTLNDGHTYHRLVTERGWPPSRYAQWLYESLVAVLLPPPLAVPGAP
jgi:AcrR family transcriptional regulator